MLILPGKKGVDTAMASKPWVQSKTIWLNVLTTFIGIATCLGGQPWVADHPAISSGIVVAIGIANVLMRFITSRPVDGPML